MGSSVQLTESNKLQTQQENEFLSSFSTPDSVSVATIIPATAAADPPRTCSTPWPPTPGSPPSWLQSRPQGSQSRPSATSDLSLSSLPPTTPSPRSPATP